MLLRPTLGLLAVCTLGAVVHHTFGAQPGEPQPSWSQAFFVSYCLLFFEFLDQVPPHPVAQVVHYLQPLLGIFLVSEGVIKLGLTVFRKDANAQEWIGNMARVSKGHVILCGLGTVGFRVLEELVSMDITVFCIEQDPDCAFLSRGKELGAEILVGDARADGLLRSLNLKRARAIIVATDDDLANLEIAMDAREIAPGLRIVMRLFDQRLAQKVKSTLGIQVSVSTSRLAAPLFASAALDPAVISTHRIGDRSVVVMELDVGPGLAGRCSTELARDLRITVVGITRGASHWEVPPPPERRLTVQDRVQLLVDGDRAEEIRLRNASG